MYANSSHSLEISRAATRPARRRHMSKLDVSRFSSGTGHSALPPHDVPVRSGIDERTGGSYPHLGHNCSLPNSFQKVRFIIA